MNRTLKAVFAMLVLILLAGGLGAGYFYTEAQQKKISEKETQIQTLKKSQDSLKEDFDKVQKMQQETIERNRDLREQVEQFDAQKKVIMGQVRSSVEGFEKFRVESTDEIAKLKTSVSELESEKTEALTKLETLETLSKSEKEKLTADVSDMSKKIEEMKSTQTQLVNNLNNTDKVAMAAETAKLHYNLGNFYFKNSNYKDAAGEYKKALFYRPDDADANYNLAMVSDNFLDDTPTALFRYNRYLELRPAAADRKKILQRTLDLQLRQTIMNDPIKKREQAIFKESGKSISRISLIGDKK